MKNQTTEMTQTWKEFLTVEVCEFKPIMINWNSEGSYKNTSPADALMRHKDMYPSHAVKIVSV